MTKEESLKKHHPFLGLNTLADGQSIIIKIDSIFKAMDDYLEANKNNVVKESLELFETMQAHQKLLSDEIESMVGLAHMHGWRSTRHEEGEKLRNKIQELKTKLGI